MRISDWSSDVCSSDLDFKAALPGWWFSVCECQVSCDASCAPTRESPDIALIEHDERLDLGFDADLPQPSTLAKALRSVMADRSEEHTSELQSLMRITYVVFCLKKKNHNQLPHPF